MSAVARTRTGRSRLGAGPTLSVVDRLRPVPVRPPGARLAQHDVAPVALPSPSMRGLEATIAIASLAAAILLGFLR